LVASYDSQGYGGGIRARLQTSQHFMEPEGSLPCAQEPSTCLYPESDQSIYTIPSYLSKIHFNIVPQLCPTQKTTLMGLQESGDGFKRFINTLRRRGFTQTTRPRASKAKKGRATQMHPTRLLNSAKHNKTEAECE
jgi:hypothetical protein